jgi:hypothetical protein
MNNVIHFFDLDGTLWGTNTKAWIIDKKHIGKPLLKLNNIELSDILSGVHKKDEIGINYNGQDYWISQEMFDKIEKKIPSIDEDRLGLSFIENIDNENIKKLSFHKNNIRHLVGKNNFDFGILSARHDVDNDDKILNLLKKELSDIGIRINKFYYVSDFFTPRKYGATSYKKADVLLEHLVGFHIKNDHFEPIKQDFYQEVNFYDDDFQNINIANDIQKTFELYLKNTDDEVFERIIETIKENKPVLITHLIVNNDVNRFKSTKIELKTPTTFPVKIEEKLSFQTKFDKYLKNKI